MGTGSESHRQTEGPQGVPEHRCTWVCRGLPECVQARPRVQGARPAPHKPGSESSHLCTHSHAEQFMSALTTVPPQARHPCAVHQLNSWTNQPSAASLPSLRPGALLSLWNPTPGSSLASGVCVPGCGVDWGPPRGQWASRRRLTQNKEADAVRWALAAGWARRRHACKCPARKCTRRPRVDGVELLSPLLGTWGLNLPSRLLIQCSHPSCRGGLPPAGLTDFSNSCPSAHTGQGPWEPRQKHGGTR